LNITSTTPDGQEITTPSKGLPPSLEIVIGAFFSKGIGSAGTP
jgi:hypothetical protein